MYGFVTHLWNPVKGTCPHECSYCYMRRFKQGPLRMDVKEAREDLGSGNTIFACSGTDLFADFVPDSWIAAVAANAWRYPGNTYLLQSKNAKRMYECARVFPEESIFCTTTESNRYYPDIMGQAPMVSDRFTYMSRLREMDKKTMLTVEPVLDFDLEEFAWMIAEVRPSQVNIGADSKGHRLPEPAAEKVLELITTLRNLGIKVHEKPNLVRITGRTGR